MPIFRYTNPITRDPKLSLRDHCIVKLGDQWFLTGTSQPIWTGVNPGVRLLVSNDLLNWKDAGWIIDASQLPDDCPYNGRFWAPEIHLSRGRFWLTVNCGHKGPLHGERRMDDHHIWLFVADQITGPYQLVTPHGLGAGFKNDASLFTDEDGRSYLYCSGGGLWQSEIDLEKGDLIGGDDLQKIRGPRDPGNPDWMIGGIEGPFVIKRHGTYWMFFSAWTRGYEIGAMHAPGPLGPWELTLYSPIFGTRKRRYREKQMRDGGYPHITFEDTADPYVEVGHNAVFEGPDGTDWLCCHYFLEGREILSTDPTVQYADSQEQLGFEPLRFRDGRWSVTGPTWTEQTIG
jgi:beta-xylosidase